MLSAGIRAALGFAAFCLLAGCSTGAPPETAASGRSIPASCVVAAPFALAPQVSAEGDDLPGLLGAYLTEALANAGLRVVGAGELAPFLASETEDAASSTRAYAQRLAFVADREFGCEVVAIGRLDRFRDRSGEAMGSTHAASVAFDLHFYGAPGGQALWEGRFDETQKALTENVWRARQYPGSGMRWLSANEFARFGVQELVSSVPLRARAAAP